MLIGSIVIILVSLIFVINNNNKKIIIGDYLLNPLANNKINLDYTFSMNDLDSSLLLEYLDNNAVDLKTKTSINRYIKKSKKIYLSVGMNDLLNYVSLSDSELNYNPTIINEKIALLEYNLHEIISSIKAIKDIEIYYFSLYYFNDSFDEVIYEYNLEIKSMLESLNAIYIETNDIIQIDEYKYTSFDQRKIYNYILEH